MSTDDIPRQETRPFRRHGCTRLGHGLGINHPGTDRRLVHFGRCGMTIPWRCPCRTRFDVEEGDGPRTGFPPELSVSLPCMGHHHGSWCRLRRMFALPSAGWAHDPDPDPNSEGVRGGCRPRCPCVEARIDRRPAHEAGPVEVGLQCLHRDRRVDWRKTRI